MPDFSTIATPLMKLPTKRAPDKVVWMDECELVFHCLKEALTTGTVLRLSDVDRDFVLRTDASDNGLVAVILQKHDGMLHQVAYGSKKLSPAEKHYTVFGVTKFEQYLYGRKFKLQTEHQPLAFFVQDKLTNGRFMRWSLFLQQYQWSYIHKVLIQFT